MLKGNNLGKVVEPKEWVEINNAIKLYGGLYANWKSGGCKGAVPKELRSRLLGIQTAIDDYLSHLGEKSDEFEF